MYPSFFDELGLIKEAGVFSRAGGKVKKGLEKRKKVWAFRERVLRGDPGVARGDLRDIERRYRAGA